MEPERERTGKHFKKGRKRRRAPNTLVGAAEAMRARWELGERQPEAKVSNGEPEREARETPSALDAAGSASPTHWPFGILLASL